MIIHKYEILTEKKNIDLRIAVVSDLHSRPYNKTIEAVKRIAPDVILLPGDIVEVAADYLEKRNKYGLDFLRDVSEIAPCYYCYGNHEIYNSHAHGKKTKVPDKQLSEEYKMRIKSWGINLINDSFERLITINKNSCDSVFVGGLVCGRDMDPSLGQKAPDLRFLKEFEGLNGFKILLCHYPHYYDRYLKETDVDLVLSGHAHGGQWRIFGRGVFAPHQGLFPKYTSGIHDGRHIISRGAVNNTKMIPRFFNPCEVLSISIHSK